MPSRGKPRPEPLIRQSYGLAAKETPADLIHLCTTHFQSVAAHTVLGLSKSFAYQSWQLSILQNRWFLLEKFRRTIPRSNPTATWSSFCPCSLLQKDFTGKICFLKKDSQLLPRILNSFHVKNLVLPENSHHRLFDFNCEVATEG